MTENETVVRRLFDEAFNQGRVEVIDELLSVDFVEHQELGPGGPAGRDAPKAVVASLRRAFSDFHLVIEDVASRDDTVWVRLRATGTQDGPFMGKEPTGKRIAITVFDVFRVVNGRIIEHWGVPDALGALRQLG